MTANKPLTGLFTQEPNAIRGSILRAYRPASPNETHAKNAAFSKEGETRTSVPDMTTTRELAL